MSMDDIQKLFFNFILEGHLSVAQKPVYATVFLHHRSPLVRGFTFFLSFVPISQSNMQIYQNLKSENPVINLSQAEWSFGESVSFPQTSTTDHTRRHTRYPVVPCVTHVPHRGESSVPRANRLIMMPIHYRAL